MLVIGCGASCAIPHLYILVSYMSEAFCESTNLFEFKVRVASISDGSDNMGWLVRSELVILVEGHVTIFFNAEIRMKV